LIDTEMLPFLGKIHMAVMTLAHAWASLVRIPVAEQRPDSVDQRIHRLSSA